MIPENPPPAHPVHPTGLDGFDAATGIGGLPKGRIVEFFGFEESGKTTFALHTMAAVQAAGGTVALIDVDGRFPAEYALALGVCLPKILLSQPDDGEQALEILESLVRSGVVDLLVVDSVAGLLPREMIAGTDVAAQVGLQERLMSKALRRLADLVSRSPTTVLFLTPMKRRVWSWGPSESKVGGNALTYYASLRVRFEKVGKILGQGSTEWGALHVRHPIVLGMAGQAKVVKNKFAPPFTTFDFAIYPGMGAEPHKIVTPEEVPHG